MEPYVHNKGNRLVQEPIPPQAPVCYLTFRAEALLDRSEAFKQKKELYKLLKLIRKKALRMEHRLRKYREAIEALGFTRKNHRAKV